MKQIILSGILGDGRLKRNGKYNYYYSECHALGEKEYLFWKYENLGRLTSTSSVYPKNANNSHVDALEFTTLTTPTLIPYAALTREEVISQLDALGILLYMLDDGWTISYKSGNAIRIGSTLLTSSQFDLFADQCENVLGIRPTIIGKKKKAIAFKSVEDVYFIDIINQYNMQSLDVTKKKFFKENTKQCI